MVGIYKIQDLETNLIYIGQSTDIQRRIREHFYKNTTTIDKLLHQKDRENFLIEIIEECPVDKLNERERYWINYYDSYYNGLNDTFGGAGIPHDVKINREDLLKIIDLLQNTTITQLTIAQKFHISKDALTDINLGHSHHQDNLEYPIRKREEPQYCSECGKLLSRGNQSGLCQECLNKRHRIVERPDKETLLKEISTTSFTKVAKKYGVSDNAIRKWCKNYNLPTHIKEIRELYLRS